MEKIKFVKEYKHYPEMVNSGIEWLGMIPKGWKVKAIKNFIYLEKGKNAQKYTLEYLNSSRGEYPVYSGITENNGILGKINDYDYDIKTTSILITTVGAKAMTTFLVTGKFSLSQNCLLLNSKGVDTKYLNYFLGVLFDNEKKSAMQIMQPSLRIKDFNKYQMLLPLEKNIQSIVYQLNDKITKIDRIIELKERLIELLKEKREAIINQAVTKGLDPNVEMVYSGIEWLGMIPKGWEVKRLRELGRLSSSSIDKISREEDLEVKMINYMNVYNNINKSITRENELMTTTATTTQKRTCGIQKGDVLITPSSETEEDIGHSVVVSDEMENTVFSYHIVRMRFNKKNENINNEYKKYFFNNHYVLKCFSSVSQGTTRMTIKRNNMNNIKVLLAPEKCQMKIARFIYSKISKIDRIIELNSNLIDLFKEYKQSLITNAVTGKIMIENTEE